MNRFFIDSNYVGSSHIEIIDRDDVHHISHVLRLKKGDTIVVCDSKGFDYTCEISEIEKDSILLYIADKQKGGREPDVRISLYQGIPKQGKFELIVQKSVELGVEKIIPVFMERSVVKETPRFTKKIERFNTVAKEAAKQCQRSFVPTVSEAADFRQILKDFKEFDIVVFPYEEEESFTIRDYLEQIKKNTVDSVRDVALVIGPEGGFSKEEASALIEKGIRPVSLGKTVLRTETAAIAALSMLIYGLDMA